MIHLGLPAPDGNTPFCGATLAPGDFVSELEPTDGGCVACKLLTAESCKEALTRLPRPVRQMELRAEVRRVRDEILVVGWVAWMKSHP